MSRIIVCFLLLCCSQVFGSTWQRLKLDDALPNVGVYSLLQDDSGFIWFGSTNIGIVRYDGNTFQSFDLSAVNPIGEVPDINTLLLDKKGTLWAGSWGYGLLRIQLQSGPVGTYNAGTAKDQLFSMYVQSLMQDDQGRVWIGTNQGLNVYQENSGLQKWFDASSAISGQPLIHSRVWAMAQTADGKIWVATSRGLHYYTDPQGMSAAIEPHGAQSPENEVRALLADGNTLWGGTRGGLFKLDTTTLALTRFPYYQSLTFPIINSLGKSRHGDLLIGSFDGISLLPNQAQRLQPLVNGGNALKGMNVRSILVDRTDLIWAGTRERAIYKGRLLTQEFNSWPAEQSYAELRSAGEPVLSFLKDGSGLWLGRANHIDWQAAGSNVLQQFQTNARVNVFARNPAGELWVGTDVGMLRYDAVAGFVSDNRLFEQLQLPTPQNVRDLLFTPDGSTVLNLWSNGVAVFNSGGSKQLLSDISRRITGDAVQDIAHIGTDLFIGTRLNGLYRYDLQLGTLERLNDKLPALSHKITCLAKGPADSLLICAGKGLQQLFLTDMLVSEVASQSNLATSELLGAYTDEADRIWLLSSQGLSVLAPDAPQMITYGEAEGLSSREMMFNAIAGEAGAVYVGTSSGVDKANTEQIWRNDVVPQTVLSQVSVDDVLLPTVWHGQCCSEITLEPNQSSLKLKFATLDFNDTSLNQTYVMLAGYDKDWQALAADNIKYYVNIPPGDYQLRFRSTNHHGQSSTLNEVPVQIKPSFWQRLEVRLGLVFVILGLLLAFYLYRLNSLRRINQLLNESVQSKALNEQQLEQKVQQRTVQLSSALTELATSNEQLKQLDGLKDDFISTVSHELRTPLTSIHGAIRLLNSGQLAQNTAFAGQLLQTAEENSHRLLFLVNDLLDLQKFESGAMKLELVPTNIAKLIGDTLGGLQSYADKYQVTLLGPTASQQPELLIDPFRIRQVLENLTSNAIKFSKSLQQVQIEYGPSRNGWLFTVTDHGDGIPPEVKRRLFSKFVQADGSSNKTRYGSGLGLVICKRIVELHGGDIGFESEPGVGSRFWFWLPGHADPPV